MSVKIGGVTNSTAFNKAFMAWSKAAFAGSMFEASSALFILAWALGVFDFISARSFLIFTASEFHPSLSSFDKKASNGAFMAWSKAAVAKSVFEANFALFILDLPLSAFDSISDRPFLIFSASALYPFLSSSDKVAYIEVNMAWSKVAFAESVFEKAPPFSFWPGL